VQSSFEVDTASRQKVRQIEVEMNAKQQQTDRVRIGYINCLHHNSTYSIIIIIIIIIIHDSFVSELHID